MIKTFVIAAMAAGAAGALADKEWKASLESKNGSKMHGSAEVRSRGTDSTRAQIKVEDAGKSMNYLWHVHNATCDTEGAIVGDPAAYPELRTTDEGKAEVEVTIAVATPEEGSYSVHVHQKPAATDTVKAGPTVACGNLEKK